MAVRYGTRSRRTTSRRSGRTSSRRSSRYSRRRYSRRSSYRSSAVSNFRRRSNVSARKELKTADSIFTIGAKDGIANWQFYDYGSWDATSRMRHYISNPQRFTGIAQGNGAHTRIGNTCTSLYLNLSMSFVSAQVSAVTNNDNEVDPRVIYEGGTIANAPRSVNTVSNATNFNMDTVQWGSTSGISNSTGNIAGQNYAGIMVSSNDSFVNNGTYQSHYIRTLHRVVIFSDNREPDDQQTFSVANLFETESVFRNPVPCALSNLNSANFGRYTIHYDNSFVTDGDDPTKIINVRSLPYRKRLRYYGPDASDTSAGSLYVVYACTISDAANTDSSGYFPSRMSAVTRQCFYDD